MASITDPMWCPEVSVLQEAFPTCREFKMNYFVDRDAEKVQIRKRHRNMINRAKRAGEYRDVELADHLDRWQELYQRNVADRQIAQPFDPAYFEQLARVPGYPHRRGDRRGRDRHADDLAPATRTSSTTTTARRARPNSR